MVEFVEAAVLVVFAGAFVLASCVGGFQRELFDGVLIWYVLLGRIFILMVDKTRR